MRIKLLQTVLVTGFKNARRAGSVIERKSATEIEEAEGLIGLGYAKETDEDVTDEGEPVAELIEEAPKPAKPQPQGKAEKGAPENK